MKRKAAETEDQGALLSVMRWLAGIAIKCSRRQPRLFVPAQPDGWSAQPIAIERRFAADADLDPVTGIPVGDEGYYLYILNEAANWDYSTTESLIFSIWQRPWAHSWLILESPEKRVQFGHTGDLGQAKPRYHAGALQRIREGHPDPLGYLWQTMADGRLQAGQPNRPPTFVWRMPITRCRHQRIHESVVQRTYDQFGLQTDNCTDMVVATALLAGLHLIHRIRITPPQVVKIWGRKRRLWTDSRYRIVDFSAPDVLETDLRHLAQLGIGSDATQWYLTSQWRRSHRDMDLSRDSEAMGELS
ncbi:MAG: hypothetical protein KFF45_00790 [Thioalkalivibrio sp.]|nr:hypothetical protein [Thioalkalivibrio sp.]